MRTPSEIVCGNPWIQVVGLNRGTGARWPKLRVQPVRWDEMVESVRERGGPIPDLPGLEFTIAPSPGGAVIWVARQRHPIFNCGMCWREDHAEEIWDFLVGLREDIFGGSSRWLRDLHQKRPESLPWIAEMSRSPELSFTSSEALGLARFFCMLLPLLEYLEK